MPSMSARVFVDTSVLVYWRDSSEPAKQKRAQEWLEWLWDRSAGRISLQVLQEYYVTVTRKLDVSLPVAEARDDVRTFMAWSPPSPGLDLFERAWSLQERFSLSWWDAMIVASGLEQGSDFLLSEDLQAGRNLDGMLVVNPFATLPSDVFS
jgi:predicted nucleic acid-binding protein